MQILYQTMLMEKCSQKNSLWSENKIDDFLISYIFAIVLLSPVLDKCQKAQFLLLEGL